MENNLTQRREGAKFMAGLDSPAPSCHTVCMEITDLQETAALAHIKLNEKELGGALLAFEQMLGYFAAMQAADTDSQAFTASIAASTEGMAASSRMVKADYFRADNAPLEGKAEGGHCETMLAQAGERDGCFIVIPNVL